MHATPRPKASHLLLVVLPNRKVELKDYSSVFQTALLVMSCAAVDNWEVQERGEKGRGREEEKGRKRDGKRGERMRRRKEGKEKEGRKGRGKRRWKEVGEGEVRGRGRERK